LNLNDNQLRSTIPDSLSHLEALEYMLSSHGCILVAASTDTAPLTGAGPILLQVSRPGVEPRHFRHTPYQTDSADKSSVSSSMASESPLISALRVDVLLRVRVTVHFPLICQRPLGTAESCRSLFVSGRGAHLTGTVPSSLLSLPSLTYVLPASAHALAASAVVLLYSTSTVKRFGLF
jgi:hypothetical protein